MDAIILAAGRGTRLRPLTDTTPKPLVPVAGRGTMLRTLDILPASIDRLIIVINYLGEQIQQTIGENWKDKHVIYVIQEHMDGSGGAVRACQSILRSETFLVLNGDDLYAEEDIQHLAECPRSLLSVEQCIIKPTDSWLKDSGDRITGMTSQQSSGCAWLNIGAYHLGQEWYSTIPVFTPGKDAEYSLPHAIPQLISQWSYRLIPASFWMPCGTIEEIDSAERVLHGRT